MRYLDTLLSWRIVPSAIVGSYLAGELSFYFFPIGTASNVLVCFHYLVFSYAFILLLSCATYLSSSLIWAAVHRRRQSRKLPKAVARFPHNHLKVLGVDKLKKYVPPASPTTKIVSVNLQGIKKFLGWKGTVEELKRHKLD
ncbi:MAG: hypothetical protein G01um101413_735 [Parcubacteria group bacterium Gr01-1014_13]|nr:MAG: hypothetical protein G01um101413_735 [Parcubacteria group bacterium Gr01-1014_13]